MHTEGNRKNKTALITGSTSGMGLCFADNLAQQGYNIMIVGIREDAVKQTAEDFKNKYDVDVYSFCLDLSEIDAAEKVYAFCQENNIEIHILINNAGRLMLGAVTDLNTYNFNSCLQLHINTPAKLARLFGTDMKARQEGYILTVSSLAAWMPYPYFSLYASTKQFLKTFFKAIHYEFSGYNVGVTHICPGAIDTNLFPLKPQLRKLARNLGIMMTPDKLAKRALKKMFRKKVCYVPGIINKIAVPFLLIFPVKIIGLFIKNKIMPYYSTV